MKKSKIILASLCASAMLFSATTSFSLVSEKKEYRSYEAKAERIVEFMKNSDEYYLLPSFYQTTYGTYAVMLGYDKETEDIEIAIWDKDNSPIFDKPDIVIWDRKDNKYGRLDEIHKKREEGKGYVQIDDKTLTNIQIHNLVNIYQGIIAKFYNENEDKMEMLEKLPEQNKEMEELFNILKKK